MVGGVGPLVLIRWPALTYYFVVLSNERPRYSLVKVLRAGSWWRSGMSRIELRTYAPYICAEVVIGEDKPMRSALGSGFKMVRATCRHSGARVLHATKMCQQLGVLVYRSGRQLHIRE